MSNCLFCDNETIPGTNFCDWDCHVKMAQKLGGKDHRPNKLPVNCIMADGTMLECEHGDHPSYKFPIMVEIPEKDRKAHFMYEQSDGHTYELSDEDIQNESVHERHALIFFDDTVALTLFEHVYYMWSLSSGYCIRDPFAFKGEKSYWKICDSDLEKIRNETFKVQFTL